MRVTTWTGIQRTLSSENFVSAILTIRSGNRSRKIVKNELRLGCGTGTEDVI